MKKKNLKISTSLEVYLNDISQRYLIPVKKQKYLNFMQCVKSIRNSGPHFFAFGLNTKRYGVFLHIQSDCGKMPTRITPNTDTFYGVMVSGKELNLI